MCRAHKLDVIDRPIKHKSTSSQLLVYRSHIMNLKQNKRTGILLIGKRSKAVTASGCRRLLAQRAWHLLLHLLLLISDWKCVREAGQEAWWGKEYSLTWEMEHVVLCTQTPMEPNIGCSPPWHPPKKWNIWNPTVKFPMLLEINQNCNSTNFKMTGEKTQLAPKQSWKLLTVTEKSCWYSFTI